MIPRPENIEVFHKRHAQEEAAYRAKVHQGRKTLKNNSQVREILKAIVDVLLFTNHVMVNVWEMLYIERAIRSLTCWISCRGLAVTGNRRHVQLRSQGEPCYNRGEGEVSPEMGCWEDG